MVGSRLLEVEGVNVTTPPHFIEQVQLARGPVVHVRFELPVHVAIQESRSDAAGTRVPQRIAGTYGRLAIPA